MAYLVRMPALTEMMTEGIIVDWQVAEGDQVKVGQTLFNIETEKANFEIPAAEGGTVLKIITQQGETAPVGMVVAVIGTPDESWEVPGAPSPTASVAASAAVAAVAADPAQKQPISPAARRLAREHGLDLDQIVGTGPDGMVTKEDVEAHLSGLPGRAGSGEAAAEPPAYGPEEVVAFAGRRKAIAERMALSRRTVADVTTVMDVDCHELQQLRETVAPYSYTTFVIAAAARTLANYPYLNAVLDGDRIILKKYYNMAVSVDTDEGLTTPVVAGADRLALGAIQARLRELTDKARSRSLAATDLDGGTFTITNAGVYGSLLSTPIINYPQCAILGMGKVMRTPVAIGEEVVIRPMMYLFLTYDHRVVDGGQAVRFLADVKQMLEHPHRLVQTQGA